MHFIFTCIDSEERNTLSKCQKLHFYMYLQSSWQQTCEKFLAPYSLAMYSWSTYLATHKAPTVTMSTRKLSWVFSFQHEFIYWTKRNNTYLCILYAPLPSFIHCFSKWFTLLLFILRYGNSHLQIILYTYTHTIDTFHANKLQKTVISFSICSLSFLTSTRVKGTCMFMLRVKQVEVISSHVYLGVIFMARYRQAKGYASSSLLEIWCYQVHFQELCTKGWLFDKITTLLLMYANGLLCH